MSAKLSVIGFVILILGVIGAGCYEAKTRLDAGVSNNKVVSNIKFESNSRISDNNDVGNNPNIPDSPQKLNSDLHKSPYQTKPRRTKIKFPDDCTDVIPAGEKIRYLPTACAEALRSVQSDLQKAAEEGNCSSPIDNENNRSNAVVDDDEVLSYTIKNSDETNIAVITQKLGTVIESFIKNNKLDYPIKFKVGQELKYQKAHCEYDFEPLFYTLSSNKYLVEIGCWTAAYNLPNIYLLYDESAIPAKAQVLEFPWIKITTDEDSDVPKTVENVTVKDVGGRWFDPKTKELIVFDKAHGIGDAGEYARYSFPNGKPKLEEFRAKFKWEGQSYQADDVIKSPPKTWKRYYPK